MANPSRSKKKIKKNVVDGIVHVHATFNLGLRQVVLDLEALEKVHLLLHRWLQNVQAKLQKNMV
jgi:transposase-like protein